MLPADGGFYPEHAGTAAVKAGLVEGIRPEVFRHPALHVHLEHDAFFNGIVAVEDRTGDVPVGLREETHAAEIDPQYGDAGFADDAGATEECAVPAETEHHIGAGLRARGVTELVKPGPSFPEAPQKGAYAGIFFQRELLDVIA